MTDDHPTVARSGTGDADAGGRDPEDEPDRASDDTQRTPSRPERATGDDGTCDPDGDPDREGSGDRSRAERAPRPPGRPRDEPPPTPVRRQPGATGDDTRSVVPRSVLELLRLLRVVGEAVLAVARLFRHL